MKIFVALACALLAFGKTAATTCNVCSFTPGYDIDRDNSPKLSALFDNLLLNDTEGCLDNKGVSVAECGPNTPCALIRYKVKLSLVNADGSTESATISDRLARKCSPVRTSQMPEGCSDIANAYDNGLFVTYLKMQLTQILGYLFDGELYADDLQGYYCNYCCHDNSNDALAHDIDA